MRRATIRAMMNSNMAWAYLLLNRQPDRPTARRDPERELLPRLACEDRRGARRSRRRAPR
jgi:hypothetical protein